MKKKHVLVLAALVMAITSLACARLLPAPQPTEEPFPTFDWVRDALKFEPATLPAAQIGVPYEVEILITQVETPAGDISISDGVLPPGLELVKVEDKDAARITGMPQEAGTFSFTVYVWCYGTQVSGQTGEMKYEIVVDE
jgi:hypothetical protein